MEKLANNINRTFSRSEALAKKIDKAIPGGVNSPFRSFAEVGGHTIFFAKAEGSKLYDVDGNIYIDYLGAWGPAILGHCPPQVVEKCRQAVSLAPVFGTPHEYELELADLLMSLVPSLEMVRFVNSGTEAVMSALRLARGYTNKDLIVMFEGCYHGHSDSVLASQNHSSSSGIPKSSKQNTLLLPYNDLAAFKDCIKTLKQDIAAVIIEPVACSMGVIPPEPGYLQGIADICRQNNILFILDEVLTGLRLAGGSAQSLYKISPDISCFGKALGGGMPIGAYGGRREIMERLQPLGDVYQAGTFSGNPVTMAGGIETLKLLADPNIHKILENRSELLFSLLQKSINKHSLPVQLQRVGSLFSVLFAAAPVRNFRDSQMINNKQFSYFFHHLIKQGIYFPPSAVDAACVSAAHTLSDIEDTANVCEQALHEACSLI